LGYTQAEFFTEEQMLKAYLEADIVISRAGIGTLSELAALHKATILVPMPNSHQEENVQILGDAVLSVSQQAENAPEQLMKAIGRFKGIDIRQAYGERLHVALPTDTTEA
jgi:UDP-N-acetylglucosamine:LPS N-acetylglucosamine transferase